MASWCSSTLRLRRNKLINVFYLSSPLRAFSIETDDNTGRGQGNTSLSIEKPTAPGSDSPSKLPLVQGRGRRSRFAEQLGLRFDPGKEEAKIREYIPEEVPHASRYENVDEADKQEVKIRVVSPLQDKEDAPDFQKLDHAVEKLHSEVKISVENLKSEEKIGVQEAPEVAELTVDSSAAFSKQEEDWISELSPGRKVNNEETWLDELSPGTKITKPKFSESVSVQQSKILEEIKVAKLVLEKVVQKEEHFPPVHKAYQEDDETDVTSTVEPVQTVVDEFILEDKSSKDGKILVQFEDEEDSYVSENKDGREEMFDRSEDSKQGQGAALKSVENEELSHIPETVKGNEQRINIPEAPEEILEAQEEDKSEEEILIPQEDVKSKKDMVEEPEDIERDQGDDDGGQEGSSTVAVNQHDDDNVKAPKPLQEAEIPEDVVQSPNVGAFERFTNKMNLKQETLADSKMERGGLASILEKLIKKDKKATDSRPASSGSLMKDLGWDQGQQPVAAQNEQMETRASGIDQRQVETPLSSALAERLGWTAAENALPIDFAALEMDMDQDEGSRRQKSGSMRMMDAYGRLKARTPEERRQRAMRSVKAMEMALRGKLDEFNPDEYEEPELPELPPRTRGRAMRGRGRSRGRGRGRGNVERRVPNLFQQPSIRQSPVMEITPHKQEDYYHEDVMSKLGIKFDQHDLMNLERHVQSLTSPSFNFSTGDPLHWTRVNATSPGAYVEQHKGKIKAVMKASGFDFAEEKWIDLKTKALRDLEFYRDQNRHKKEAFGQSSFANVKDEETYLKSLVANTLSAKDPLHDHMKTTLPFLLSNPTWAYAQKKAFVDLASNFSNPSDRDSL